MPRSTIRAVPEIDFVSRRSDMVKHQIAARGVRSKLVLEAMRKVPREEFLPPSLREFAYEDSALPIAEGQTISNRISSLLWPMRCYLKAASRF
jgi:protein-L-isoaspartate O-methyltransferase